MGKNVRDAQKKAYEVRVAAVYILTCCQLCTPTAHKFGDLRFWYTDLECKQQLDISFKNPVAAKAFKFHAVSTYCQMKTVFMVTIEPFVATVQAVDVINWPEGFVRRDIGWRAIERMS